MRISKVLYKSKTLANKEHPVMIRISHKGQKKYVSTTISCKVEHWSKTKNLVGAKDPHKESKNRIISEKYKSLQERLDEFEQNGISPTIEMLLSGDEVQDKDNDMGNFITIFNSKAESCKAPRTKSEYLTFKRVLESLYGGYINVRDIDQAWVNELRVKIDNHYGEKNSQKNHFIKCFAGAYSHAEEIGSIPYRKNLKFKNFKHEKTDKFLTNEQITTIISAYKKEIVVCPGVISEKDRLALSLFILMMAFQGIANIDLAGVKIKDIEIKKIKKVDIDVEQYNNSPSYREKIDSEQEEREVVSLTLHRRKTGRRVRVIADYVSISPILEKLMEGKTREDYLIPCFSEKTLNDEKKEIEYSARFFNKNKKILNEYLERFCPSAGYKKIENLTYYQARSAYANSVAKLGIPHNMIQKLLGQKQSVLEEHYIRPLTDWEISQVSFNIFNQVETIANLLSQRVGG